MDPLGPAARSPRRVLRVAVAVALCGTCSVVVLGPTAPAAALPAAGWLQGARSTLTGSGVPADLLVVEVAEAALLAGDPGTAEVLCELAALGVRVTVDDVGTGATALAHLTRWPVHALKIHRSLTAALADLGARAVVEAVVGMGRAPGLEVVAGGVEQEAQAQALARAGVWCAQGWSWAPALPPEEAAALARRHGAGPTAPVPPAAGGVPRTPGPHSRERTVQR